MGWPNIRLHERTWVHVIQMLTNAYSVGFPRYIQSKNGRGSELTMFSDSSNDAMCTAAAACIR